jgi:hypothetical protein
MSRAIKDFKGYAVGGDDTEWKKFIATRFTEILDDPMTERIISPDTINDSKDDEDINDFINAMSSFVDVTQNIIGDTTISHSPKSSSVGQIKTDIIRGLV